MSLSSKQKSQAQTMVDCDLIQELDSETWLVSSISGRGSYEVQRIYDKSYDLYCKCTGWKFSSPDKDCKHCEAIRILRGTE